MCDIHVGEGDFYIVLLDSETYFTRCDRWRYRVFEGRIIDGNVINKKSK